MWKTWVRSMGREDSPGGGHGNPPQYSCLEKPLDRGDWRAAVHGVAQSRTQLRDSARHSTICNLPQLCMHAAVFSPLWFLCIFHARRPLSRCVHCSEVSEAPRLSLSQDQASGLVLECRGRTQRPAEVQQPPHCGSIPGPERTHRRYLPTPSSAPPPLN